MSLSPEAWWRTDWQDYPSSPAMTPACHNLTALLLLVVCFFDHRILVVKQRPCTFFIVKKKIGIVRELDILTSVIHVLVEDFRQRRTDFAKLEEAKSLAPEDRWDLIEALQESLEGDSREPSDDVANAMLARVLD